MANTFKSIHAEAVSNASANPTTVLQCPGANASKCVLIGVQIGNTHTSQIAASVALKKSDTTTYHTVDVDSGVYRINGSATPSITVKKGHTYYFDVSDPSNDTHSFGFSSTDPSGSPTAISAGVSSSGTAGDKNAYVKWVVDAATTAAWYYCSAHATNNYMNSAPTAFTIAEDTAEASTLLDEVPIPANSMLSVLGGDKVILEENDSLTVFADTASACNVYVNYLLIDNT